MIDVHNEQEYNNNNNNNKFDNSNDDNLYITITNSNSMNDKTTLLEKLLKKLNNKMTINIFTETCLQKDLPENYLGRKWFHALTTTEDKNGGVSICYHPAFGNAVAIAVSPTIKNRLLAIKFSPPQRPPFVIIAIYIHASMNDVDKCTYLQLCLCEINEIKKICPRIIIGGDFNMLILSETENMYHGHSKQSMNKSYGPGVLDYWMTNHDFVHPFKKLKEYPYEKYLTFSTGEMAKGIDHHFLSGILADNIIDLQLSNYQFAHSKHKSVCLTLSNMVDNPLGMNFKHRIPDYVWNIPWFKTATENNIRDLNFNFTNEKYDKFIKDTTTKANNIATNRISELFKKLSTTTNKDTITTLKLELKNLLPTKIRNWKREISNCISEIDGSAKNIDIKSSAQEHFCKLYSEDTSLKDENEILEFLHKSNIKPITSEEKTKLNEPFDVTEFDNIIFKQKKTTSIGPDEISNEFLRLEGMSTLMMTITNNLMSGKSLPSSLSKTFIRLVHKSDCRTSLKNYRPIGITSLGYKLIASVIVERLAKILPNIIGNHQQGYIKGRRMAPHTKAINEILFQCMCKNEECVTLKTDFEQAFDNLSNNYIKTTLQYLNFGNRLVTLIMLLNSSLIGIIIINNTHSLPFNIRRGVVQGSPLSALIFIIALEPLLTTATNDPKFGHYKMFSTDLHVLGFCDDLYILTTLTGIENWMLLLTYWQKLSGDRLKVKKCLINLLGKANISKLNAVTKIMIEKFQLNGVP